MHSHQVPEMPFWKKFLGAIPIVGSFVDPKNENVPQAFDGALYDASAIVGQVAFTYFCPFGLTASFPKIFNDEMKQMEAEMFAEMSARMWLGDAIGKATYRIIVHPIKIAVDHVREATFKENETVFAVKIAQILLPMIGPFLGAENWKQALSNGVKGNIQQLAMMTGGAYMMMLSPYGMETDAVSISVGTGLMVAGMGATMIFETVSKEVLAKSYQAVIQCGMWCRNKEGKKEEKESLLVMEERRETEILNELPSPS